jgi:hypothetical protein
MTAKLEVWLSKTGNGVRWTLLRTLKKRCLIRSVEFSQIAQPDVDGSDGLDESDELDGPASKHASRKFVKTWSVSVTNELQSPEIEHSQP